ncbi:MAG: methyltransferase, partial [Acidobacteriota bacterium]
MTSRDLVRNALGFSSPPRIPRQLWLLPWANIHYPEELARIQRRYPDDLITAPPFYRELLRTTGDEYGVGTYIDEWGCQFEGRQRGVIGEVKEPLVGNWQDLDKVRVPRERLSMDVAQINAFCRSRDEFVLSKWCGRPFEQLQFIRQPENLYLDLAERPPQLSRLLERLHHFYCE